MNCHEFSVHAAELARAGMLEAAAREGALSHAEECAPCAARLGRERSLTSALRATAESMTGEAAPARVEAALLAAFRESRDGGRAPLLAPPAGRGWAARVSAARAALRPRRALAASAVAASLLLAFTVARRAQFADGQAAHSVVAVNPQPNAQPAPAPVTKSDGGEQTTARPTPEAEKVSNGVQAGGAGKSERARLAAGGRSIRRAMPEYVASFEMDGGRALTGDEGAAPVEASGAAPAPADTESLTDFVPVAAGLNAGPMDGGQLVRVKVPRAALASLGLPVSSELAGETVKADLLLGHDGTARAIRLVR